MVLITEDLVRRRSEHNNCEIFSLEEVSLHQQDVEKIEHIDRWCKDLKILYLQNNLIPRIENVHRLKKLEYLNLALNNIELIENLEGCESLQKLDLTVNFIGCLSSVESLKHNLHLQELFLVGNPCTEFEGYRQYVVATLPQLKYLDGKEIGRSERIRSGQGLKEVRRLIHQQEQEYLRKRASERQKSQEEGVEEVQQEPKKPGFDGRWYTDINKTMPVPEDNTENQVREEKERKSCPTSDHQEREFWEKLCAFTPESRLETHRHLERSKKAERRETEKMPKAQRTLITPQGRVMNVNEPKLDFRLTEDENNNAIVLDLEVYRHMDTSLMDVDVQPTYARVTVKGKVVLPAEVRPDSSTAKRSQITGHLVLTMPKALCEIKAKKTTPTAKSSECSNRPEEKTRKGNREERLEVDPREHSMVDFCNIVPREISSGEGSLETSGKRLTTTTEQTNFSDNFVDDPDVPPLI
ncbi:protein tilB homolog isoform X2 [Esox lucius]|uniref:protein tilB homolog isoform X2 n=1 Tax=Esox lucius TaxID=8010 RepID=UPI001476881B|nr:protein tilB homolog isoform X2 [Esox lucius]